MKQFLEHLMEKVVREEFGAEYGPERFSVTTTPKSEMGDYATNIAMVLAKKLGRSPKEVAEQIVKSERLKVESIRKVEAVGGFINFYLAPGAWFKEVLERICERKTDYGKVVLENPENIMVEYLSPNTNKPLHLGHLRNGVIGSAVISLLKNQGHRVIASGIINDRGVHICKAMLAYKNWGNGSTPESSGIKPDHFVGSWYVRFAQEALQNPKLEAEAQEMLRLWEAGDAEVRSLWSTIRQWVLDGWKHTEHVLGFSYDKVYFESDVYMQGREVVEQGVATGVFRKNEKGNVVFDLPLTEFGTDEDGNQRMITLLRPDGTTLYTTQDLGLAIRRAKELSLDRLVFVVGSEQRFHFEALFSMLKALGYEWADKLYHLWYGMVYLPDGRMKSREGTVVDTDDLVREMTNMAKQEIEQRSGGSTENNHGVEDRASKVALAAIKFYFLKQSATSPITFNPKESISFEGFTGPYCQYTYARCKSILAKSKQHSLPNTMERVDFSVLGNEDERVLLRLLESFPEVLLKAAEEYDPSILANYVFQVARIFNQFYSSSPVMQAEDKLRVARVYLVEATSYVLMSGLSVLGIDTLEHM